MINVSIVKDSSGFIWQFSVEGHAGYAEEGWDIVCAAASVTAYTAAGALEDIAGIEVSYTESDGYFLYSVPADLTEQQKQTADIILKTMEIGFRQIELSYGKFISVVEEEV